MGGGPWDPGASYDEVAEATPVFGTADANVIMCGGGGMCGSGTLACYSSSVVKHALVLHSSVACVERSQVRHGAARVERGHHVLWHCLDVI